MTLDEAFDILELTPVQQRLLIGRPDGDDIDWEPEHIDNFPKASYLWVDIAQAVDEFFSAEGTMMVMQVEAVPTGHVVVAFGPGSRDAVSNALTKIIQDLPRPRSH